jgi:hypothetical protein
MEKNEVVAYLVMEAATEPVKPMNLQVYDKNNLFYLNFDAILQEYDVFNRNRRKYMLEPMKISLNAPHLIELLKKKSLLGEAGHPLTDDIKRILTIDPKLTSHRINNYELQGKYLKGNIDTLDDNAYGTQMTKNMLQGIESAFSLRALAQLIKQRDGSQLMNSRAHVVTFDRVLLPSHPCAYRDESKPIQKIIKSVELAGNSMTTESAIVVQESSLLDFIKCESKNVKLVSNVCEVAMESMTLSSDLKHVILKEEGNTYFVNIEEKIKRDVTKFMSNL